MYLFFDVFYFLLCSCISLINQWFWTQFHLMPLMCWFKKEKKRWWRAHRVWDWFLHISRCIISACNKNLNLINVVHPRGSHFTINYCIDIFLIYWKIHLLLIWIFDVNIVSNAKFSGINVITLKFKYFHFYDLVLNGLTT